MRKIDAQQRIIIKKTVFVLDRRDGQGVAAILHCGNYKARGNSQINIVLRRENQIKNPQPSCRLGSYVAVCGKMKQKRSR